VGNAAAGRRDIVERDKSLAEFADYSDDADSAKSTHGGVSFLNSPVSLRAMMRSALAMLVMGVLAIATGCHAIDFYTPSLQKPVSPELEPPRELSMVSLPAYRIEPPDTLYIDVVKLVPRDSYRIGPSDLLMLNVLGTLKDHPIHGYYNVQNDGIVNLQAPYGTIRLEGMTLDEARVELTRILQFILKEPVVVIQLGRSAAVDRVNDVYRVQPDGTVNLRNYGMVHMAGKTVTEARAAVQERLTQYFDSPDVGVDVVEYNSKSYYLIFESLLGAGTMVRFPITGNETVLDAIAKTEKLSSASSKTIWISRPAPGNFGRDQILPVDLDAITHGGITDTNYQILPGDRIFIAKDSVAAANAFLSTFLDPVERLIGATSQGVSTITDVETLGRVYNARAVR
jgi:polysaccharide export outer membrane protein